MAVVTSQGLLGETRWQWSGWLVFPPGGEALFPASSYSTASWPATLRPTLAPPNSASPSSSSWCYCYSFAASICSSCSLSSSYSSFFVFLLLSLRILVPLTVVPPLLILLFLVSYIAIVFFFSFCFFLVHFLSTSFATAVADTTSSCLEFFFSLSSSFSTAAALSFAIPYYSPIASVPPPSSTLMYSCSSLHALPNSLPPHSIPSPPPLSLITLSSSEVFTYLRATQIQDQVPVILS